MFCQYKKLSDMFYVSFKRFEKYCVKIKNREENRQFLRLQEKRSLRNKISGEYSQNNIKNHV